MSLEYHVFTNFMDQSLILTSYQKLTFGSLWNDFHNNNINTNVSAKYSGPPEEGQSTWPKCWYFCCCCESFQKESHVNVIMTTESQPLPTKSY